MSQGIPHHPLSTRRPFLGSAGSAALAVLSAPAWAETMINLPLPGGPGRRPITTEFPQKGAMILQRTRPPLLETPFDVFDQSVLTPNDRFFVRWHWAVIPTEVNVDTFRLTVRGHVNRTLSLSLKHTKAQTHQDREHRALSRHRVVHEIGMFTFSSRTEPMTAI